MAPESRGSGVCASLSTPTRLRLLCDRSRPPRRAGRRTLRCGGVPNLNYLRHLEMIVHVLTQSSRSIFLADMLVVRNTCEEVVAPGGNVGRLPLFALQRHVALLLLSLEILEENRHAMPSCVLERESDEDEADTKLAQVIPCDGALLVEPLER